MAAEIAMPDFFPKYLTHEIFNASISNPHVIILLNGASLKGASLDACKRAIIECTRVSKLCGMNVCVIIYGKFCEKKRVQLYIVPDGSDEEKMMCDYVCGDDEGKERSGGEGEGESESEDEDEGEDEEIGISLIALIVAYLIVSRCKRSRAGIIDVTNSCVEGWEGVTECLRCRDLLDREYICGLERMLKCGFGGLSFDEYAVSKTGLNVVLKALKKHLCVVGLIRHRNCVTPSTDLRNGFSFDLTVREFNQEQVFPRLMEAMNMMGCVQDQLDMNEDQILKLQKLATTRPQLLNWPFVRDPYNRGIVNCDMRKQNDVWLESLALSVEGVSNGEFWED